MLKSRDGGRLVVANIGSSGLDGNCAIGSSGQDGGSCLLPIKNGDNLLKKGVINVGDPVFITGAKNKDNRHEYIGHVTLIR